MKYRVIQRLTRFDNDETSEYFGLQLGSFETESEALACVEDRIAYMIEHVIRDDNGDATADPFFSRAMARLNDKKGEPLSDEEVDNWMYRYNRCGFPELCPFISVVRNTNENHEQNLRGR